MRKLLLGLLAVLAPALVSAQVQWKPVPPKLGFQGRLLAKDGTPLTGTKNVTFRLYTVPEGGSPVWEDPQTLSLTNGFYATFLGASQLDTSKFDGSDLYVGITVDGAELKPRQRIGSVAYALLATQSVNATEADHAKRADYATNGGHAASADEATHAARADSATTAGSAGTTTNVDGGTIRNVSSALVSSLSATSASVANLTATSASMPGLVVGGASGHPSQGGIENHVNAGCDVSWGAGVCTVGFPYTDVTLSCSVGTTRTLMHDLILCVQ